MEIKDKIPLPKKNTSKHFRLRFWIISNTIADDGVIARCWDSADDVALRRRCAALQARRAVSVARQPNSTSEKKSNRIVIMRSSAIPGSSSTPFPFAGPRHQRSETCRHSALVFAVFFFFRKTMTAKQKWREALFKWHGPDYRDRKQKGWKRSVVYKWELGVSRSETECFRF